MYVYIIAPFVHRIHLLCLLVLIVIMPYEAVHIICIFIFIFYSMLWWVLWKPIALSLHPMLVVFIEHCCEPPYCIWYTLGVYNLHIRVCMQYTPIAFNVLAKYAVWYCFKFQPGWQVTSHSCYICCCYVFVYLSPLCVVCVRCHFGLFVSLVIIINTFFIRGNVWSVLNSG